MTSITGVGQIPENGNAWPSQSPANYVQIAQLEQEIERLRSVQNSLRSTTWLILHKIEGEETTFLAEPSWVLRRGKDLYLRGNSALANEVEYLKHRPDAAFVIYKHYEKACQEKEVIKAEDQGTEMPEPRPVREVLQALSNQMVIALDTFVDSHPTFKKSFPKWNSRDPVESPFLFWYCYRTTTNLNLLADPHRKQMQLLTQWIDHNYSETYAAADERLSLGRVSSSIMPFFIKPGEVLVAKDAKDIQGYIAKSWPTTGLIRYTPSSHTNGPQKISQPWTIDAWSYKYDGSFYIHSTKLTITLEFDEDNPEVNVAELNVLPLRFGSDEFRTMLEHRGRTMWACRRRNLVSYTYSGENALAGARHKPP